MDKKDILLLGLRGAHAFSPVQIQKLFFLIDENIGNMVGGQFFNFKPYDYGPFDKNVYINLEKLRDEGLVSISNDNQPSLRSYQLTPEGENEANQIATNQEDNILNYINTLSEFVRRLSFRELVAAIYDAYPQMKSNSVFFEK
ncbi:MAG: helix-turn-helix transcriptional regulator [Alphaproteobacteria bacterium]|nr:helix-turn-helix transcriptional regulator [Alphaproteobacteria bacterium]